MKGKCHELGSREQTTIRSDHEHQHEVVMYSMSNI